MAVNEEAGGDMTQQGPEEPEEHSGDLDLSGEAPSDRADVSREWFRVLIRFLGLEVDTTLGREWRGRSDRVFRMFAAGAFVLFAIVAALFTAIVMTQFVLSADIDGWRRLAVGAASFLVVFGVALLAPRLVVKDNNER